MWRYVLDSRCLSDIRDFTGHYRREDAMTKQISGKEIRHLTPAEWVNTVKGADGKEYRARLYETKHGEIRAVYSDSAGDWDLISSPWLMAILRANNNVIKPYAQTVRDHGNDPKYWPAPEPL